MTTYKDNTIEKFQFNIENKTAQDINRSFNLNHSYNTSDDTNLCWANFPINSNYAIIGVQYNNIGYHLDVTLDAANILLNNLK